MPKIRFRREGEYSTSQLAEYIGVPVGTVKSWLRRNNIPEPECRRGNKRIWNQAEADEIKRLVS